MEIPGVATMTFLRAALNAQRKKRGEVELSTPEFLKRVREVAGKLRLQYSQFLELEMFTRFGGVTDVQVKGKIARGQRIRAVLAPSFGDIFFNNSFKNGILPIRLPRASPPRVSSSIGAWPRSSRSRSETSSRRRRSRGPFRSFFSRLASVTSSRETFFWRDRSRP